MARDKHKALSVAVTREASAAAELCEALRRHGHEPVLCPLIRIGPPATWAELDAALAQGWDWVVFTSANAVRFACQRAAELGLPVHGSVACVGPSTAGVARECGLDVALVPQHHDAQGLLAALASRDMRGRRVLFPRGDLAPDTLPAGLNALGAEVCAPVVYVNQPDPQGAAKLRDLLQAGALDAVTFASASAVHAAVRAAGAGLLGQVRLTSIGPATTAALARHGLDRSTEAAGHDAEGLAAAVGE